MTLTEQAMVRTKLPPHVNMVRVKGRDYYYLQKYRGTDRAEPPVRLGDDPRLDEWWVDYARHMGMSLPPSNPLSFEALIAEYLASPDFAGLAEATKVQYRQYCKLFGTWWGRLEVAGLQPKHVLKCRDKMRDKPAAANAMLRSLSALLSWSVPRGYRADNPCKFVPSLKSGDGWGPWPWDMIELAEREAPTWMWQAVALAVYTGQRQGDVLGMSWRQVRGDTIEVRQAKTGRELIIPLHRKLAAVLSQIEKISVKILTNTRGQPWTSDGFRTSWGKALPAEIKAAGVVFHGLRKSAVVTLLEAGCTDAEVAAITGQTR
jgi:hypothetical protein